MCCAACGASEPPEKNTPGNFGACTLGVYCFFVDFCTVLRSDCCFFIDLCVFPSFLGYPSRVRPCCAACGASELSEKTRPGILEHVPSVFY